MKELKVTGKFETHEAEVITNEIEDLLWEKDVLGDSSPQQLLGTLKYICGSLFCSSEW